ncbi:hypothetical protein [Roseateles amylovorans]|uniref:Uncharacterized protein n=1 Tax=Roseateles amylovorans TaxID=2978473 RepID=A0ABY6AW29_9BURK|nr:hypothetical protein [Roseateles amylovorans]UXH77202.1 hypothetical protein N4261_19610 [Roseateles amylovorans]
MYIPPLTTPRAAHAHAEFATPASLPSALQDFLHRTPLAARVVQTLAQALEGRKERIDLSAHDPAHCLVPSGVIALLAPQVTELRLPPGCDLDTIHRWIQHADQLRVLEFPDVRTRVDHAPCIDLGPARRLEQVVVPFAVPSAFSNPRWVRIGPSASMRRQALASIPPTTGRPVLCLATPDDPVALAGDSVPGHRSLAGALPHPASPPSSAQASLANAALQASAPRTPGASPLAPLSKTLLSLSAIKTQMTEWADPKPKHRGIDNLKTMLHGMTRIMEAMPASLLPLLARPIYDTVRLMPAWSRDRPPTPAEAQAALIVLHHIDAVARVLTPDGYRLRTPTELAAVAALRAWVTETDHPDRQLVRDEVAEQLVILWSDQRPSCDVQLLFEEHGLPLELPPVAHIRALGPRAAPFDLVLGDHRARAPAAFRASAAALPLRGLELLEIPPDAVLESLVHGLRVGSLWLSKCRGGFDAKTLRRLHTHLPQLRQVMVPIDWPNHAPMVHERSLSGLKRFALSADDAQQWKSMRQLSTHEGWGQVVSVLWDGLCEAAAFIDLSEFECDLISSISADVQRELGVHLRHLCLPSGMSSTQLHDWLRACPRLERLEALDIVASEAIALDLSLGPPTLQLYTSPGWLPPMRLAGRPVPLALHTEPTEVRMDTLQGPFARPSMAALTNLYDTLMTPQQAPTDAVGIPVTDTSDVVRTQQLLRCLPDTLLSPSMRVALRDLSQRRGRWFPPDKRLDAAMVLREAQQALTQWTPQGRRAKTEDELRCRAALMQWAEAVGEPDGQQALREAVVTQLLRHVEQAVGQPIALTDDISLPQRSHDATPPRLDLPPLALLHQMGFRRDAPDAPEIDLRLKQAEPRDVDDFRQQVGDLKIRRLTLHRLSSGLAPMAWMPRSIRTLDLVSAGEHLDLPSWMTALDELPNLHCIWVHQRQWDALRIQVAALKEPEQATALLLSLAVPAMWGRVPTPMEQRQAPASEVLSWEALPIDILRRIPRQLPQLLSAATELTLPIGSPTSLINDFLRSTPFLRELTIADARQDTDEPLNLRLAPGLRLLRTGPGLLPSALIPDGVRLEASWTMDCLTDESREGSPITIPSLAPPSDLDRLIASGAVRLAIPSLWELDSITDLVFNRYGHYRGSQPDQPEQPVKAAPTSERDSAPGSTNVDKRKNRTLALHDGLNKGSALAWSDDLKLGPAAANILLLAPAAWIHSALEAHGWLYAEPRIIQSALRETSRWEHHELKDLLGAIEKVHEVLDRIFTVPGTTGTRRRLKTPAEIQADAAERIEALQPAAQEAPLVDKASEAYA